MSTEYALSLVIIGWMFGFVFGWLMRDVPRVYTTALLSLAAVVAVLSALWGAFGL